MSPAGHQQGDEDDDERDQLGGSGVGHPAVLAGSESASDCSMPMARPGDGGDQVLEPPDDRRGQGRHHEQRVGDGVSGLSGAMRMPAAPATTALTIQLGRRRGPARCRLT